MINRMSLTDIAVAATATAITEVTAGGYYREEGAVGVGMVSLVGCTLNLTFGEKNVAPVHKLMLILELGLSQVAQTPTPLQPSMYTTLYPRLGKHHM